MKKAVASLLGILLVVGFAAAAHNNQEHVGDSGVGAVSDTPNPGISDNSENATAPEKPGQDKGAVARMKGISTAVTKVPGNVADSVLTPIQEFQPGKALGNALSGVGEILQLDAADLNESVNDSGNATQ